MTVKNKSRQQIAIDNFSSAVDKLREFLSTPVVDERDRAGIIQAFEFCYELAWKSLKKLAESKGLEAPTPLDAFQAGFQMGLIKEIEHELWLDAKRTRNLTSHTYKEELAAEVLEKIRNDYLAAFEQLRQRLSKE
ncbi:MAG: HI0074 family nucleotidyltransferase substrate-binding subunit [Myxococcota bacterium]